MGLDISLLETFTLVADLGSFSGAARRLGLTQPAISFQIKSLEKELSARLIDRSGGKVVLTPAGRTAYQHARKILADRETMMSDIPRTTGEVAGRLLLGASTIPGEYILPAMLCDFRLTYPDVSISLDIDDSGGVLDKLAGEKIELGFVGTPSSDEEVEQQPFASDHLVLVTPPHHPLGLKHKVTVEDLLGEHFVNRKASSGTRHKVESALAEQGVSVSALDVVAELGSTQAVLTAVEAGMGVSLVSEKAAEQPASQGLLTSRTVTGLDLEREFFVVHSRSRALSVAAEEFLEFCLQGNA